MEPTIFTNEQMVVFKRHQIKMMQDRGYYISDVEINVLNGKSAPTSWNNVYNRVNNDTFPDDVAVVAFFPQAESGKMNKSHLTENMNIVYGMYGNNLKHLIIISDPIQKAAETDLLKMIDPKTLRVEIFKYSDFIIPVYEHRLMPKFKILTKVETTTLVSQLSRRDVHNLHKLQPTDPFVRWFDLSSANIVKFFESLSLDTSQVIPDYRKVL